MNKTSLTTALSLSVLLTACGGGGGSSSATVPVTTLPEISASNLTAMSTDSYDNSDKRLELYEYATTNQDLTKTETVQISLFSTSDTSEKSQPTQQNISDAFKGM